MTLAGRTVVVAALVGVVVTMLAGIGPALRATRVSPDVALREGAHVPPGRIGRRGPAIGAALSVLGLAIVAYGMFAGGLAAGARLVSLAPGCLALFLGVALLSPKLARPLASLLGRPGERIGGSAGELARHNAMRNPKRTAVTAAALMIGVALVAFVAVLGQGLKTSSVGNLNDSLTAQHVVVGADGWSPVDPTTAAAVRHVPGVRAVASLKQDEGRAFGKTATIDGIDPAAWTQAWSYQMAQGSESAAAGLHGHQALVRETYAKKHYLKVGDAFTVTSASGRKLTLTV